MPEYVQYSQDGKITNKWYSVPPSVIAGLSNILEIPRDIFNSLTKYHKVDAGVVREMTQAEKDTLDAAEAQAVIDAENARVLDLDNKIDNLGIMILTKIDNKIDAIGSLADAKAFLKKLCRYIIKFTAR